MSRSRIFEWHKKFIEGKEDVEDDPGAEGTQQAKRTEMLSVGEKVLSDRRLTVRMIAHELSMNSERAWTIITEDLCKNSTKVVK